MKYKMGQIIKTSNPQTPYIKPILTEKIEKQGVKNSFSVPANFNSGTFYYIKIKASKMADISYSIAIQFSLGGEVLQTVRNLKTVKGTGTQILEVVAAPNQSFDALVIGLDNLSSGVDITIESIASINNIMPSSVNQFKKVGIQARPGMIFCINGEGIRIGRTGIYELINSIFVDFIGVIIENPAAEDANFIIDYQYLGGNA